MKLDVSNLVNIANGHSSALIPKEPVPITEYSAQVQSPGFNGEAKITIQDEGVYISALFDEGVIYYSEITSFTIEDFIVKIVTETSEWIVSKLGTMYEDFYRELYFSYNRKILKAFFISKNPLFETLGSYSYKENENEQSGKAILHIYESCICILPPDDKSRRIPLCFVSNMEKDGFCLTLKLITGESYSFIKLGYDTDVFEDILKKQIFSLGKNAINAVKKIDPSIGSSESSNIARMMPEGVAVSIGALSKESGSFVNAIEQKILSSRAADEYLYLKTIIDSEKICVGTKSNLAGENEKDILWFIVQGKKIGTACVELALSEETSAATYLYRFDGSWDVFSKNLNRAMEAINFKREAVSLSFEELKKVQYSNYAMAEKRTQALKFVRKCYAGRVVHSNLESWKKEISDFML